MSWKGRVEADFEDQLEEIASDPSREQGVVSAARRSWSRRPIVSTYRPSSILPTKPTSGGLCVVCGAQFATSAEESRFFLRHSLQLPKRCSGCRRGGSTAQKRAAAPPKGVVVVADVPPYILLGCADTEAAASA